TAAGMPARYFNGMAIQRRTRKETASICPVSRRKGMGLFTVRWAPLERRTSTRSSGDGQTMAVETTTLPSGILLFLQQVLDPDLRFLPPETMLAEFALLVE